MNQSILTDPKFRDVCENCQSGPLDQFIVPGRTTLWRCPSCGLFQKGSAADTADYQLKYHAKYAAARRRKLRTAHVRLCRLAPYVSRRHPRLLDIGCSMGTTVEMALRFGWDAFGTDISADAVAVCRERGLPCHLAKRDQLPFPSEMFDVVTAWHVIEHVPDVTHALGEWYRVLAPGGLMVLETPAADCLKARLWQQRYRKFWPPGHRYTFTQSNLAALVQRAGFEICPTPWVVRPQEGRPEMMLFGMAYQLIYAATRCTRTSKAFQVFCRRPHVLAASQPLPRAA